MAEWLAAAQAEPEELEELDVEFQQASCTFPHQP
jgi:hypothetical protein